MSNPPSPEKATLQGRVQKYHSNFYYVNVDGTLYECSLRGLLKKEGTEVLVGDQVTIDSVDAASHTGRVQSVLERHNQMTRPKIANVEQAIVVYSLVQPVFDPQQTDRYLTHIELAGLSPALCISKVDLGEKEDLDRIQDLYGEQLGYPLVFTSVFEDGTLQPMLALAQNKISVLAGPSGSGKSSLLNALRPELNLRVGEVSDKLERGQHTTRHVELLQVAHNTYVADTPGFSNLKFNYVLPVEIRNVFRGFEPFASQCYFDDCLHVDEEGCAVRENLGEGVGRVSESRYLSYCQMVAEAMAYKEESQASSSKEEYGYKKMDRKGKDSVKILRLKEKNRDASRRTQRQQVEGMLEDADEDEGFLADPPPDSL